MINGSAGQQWFQEARFGMFLHWGCYSLIGRGEWDMYHSRTPLAEYRELAKQFDPQHFDPWHWAKIAVAAGMKYMVFTARHHDGFCLYDSKVSDFTSVKCSPQHKDYVAEFVAACREYGLRVGLYYSLMDWRFPGYFEYKNDPTDAEAMCRQCHDQVRELLTNYGKIDELWYDGLWLAHDAETDRSGFCAEFWRAKELENMARSLQPDLLINNRSGVEADFTTPEGRVVPPDDQSRRWESCMTMNSAWGHIADPDPLLMMPPQIIKNLVDCARNEGNYLLNFAVKPDGSISTEAETVLRKVGRWLDVNGAAIYNSRRVPFLNTCLIGGWTRNANLHYVICWAFPACGALVLPALKTRLKTAKLLGSRAKLTIDYASNGRLIIGNFPKRVPVYPFPVLQLEFDGLPELVDETANMAGWLTGNAIG